MAWEAISPDGVEAREGVTVSGQVRDARSRRPVVQAVVRVDGTELRALTSADGRFSLAGVPPGPARLVIIAGGYEQATLSVQVDAGRPLTADVLLTRLSQASGDVVVIEEKAEAPAPVVRKITVDEIQRIPGTFGDAVRVVQNLPGVARTPFGLGFLIVRGTEPEDTGTYVDGIRVPLIFHFGGLTAVINSDMLEKVEFLPGGYGARYGRNLGGVVDVSTKEIRPTEDSGYADIDLIDTTLYYSLPVGDRGGVTASVRRSYIDAVMKPILPVILDQFADPGADPSFQLPVYEDYQILYDTAIGDNHLLHVLAFGSRDRFSLADGDPPASADPLIVEGGDAGLTVLNHKLLTRWTWVPSSSFTNRLTLGVGPDGNRINLGAFRIDATPFSVFLRDDLYWEARPWLRLRGGLDMLAAWYDFRLELPFAVDTTELDPLGEPDADSLELSGVALSPAPWVEAEVEAGRLGVVPGIRVDPHMVWQTGTEGLVYHAATVDPRISAQWRLARRTVLKGSVGRFSNAPAPYAINTELGGDPSLKPEWAIQSTLGVEHRFTDAISIDGSVYRGDLRDLLTTSGGGDGGSLFEPSGGGVNQGLELLLRHDPVDTGFFGWISYTLQRAERTDDIANACPRVGDDPGPEGCSPWTLFDFDQTHILTVVASEKLPRGWEVGLRFRYTTGGPYTPIVDSYYDVDDDGYQPLYGDRNSVRFPPFHELDLRVDKKIPRRWGELAFALEVLNVYNRQNPEAVQYSFDYSQSRFVSGIPLFPAFGVKARF